MAEIEDCLGDDCGGAPLSWPPPQPAEDPIEPDPWDPIIPGGGTYSPCETCDPGEDPDNEETCPLGQIDDGFGNYIDEEGETEPCVGNPVKNPRIAPQENSGINGGRFGFTRINPDGSPKEHSALDIKVNFGEPIYSMFDGIIINTGYQEDGWGNWILIKSDIGGTDYYLLYAHLDDINYISGSIPAGSMLGTAGDSGNLKEAINEGFAVMHLHLEIRKVLSGVTFNNSEKINPEEVLTTKFSSTEEPLLETDC